MTRRCSACGAEPRHEAKFCDQCGAAVDAPESAEYKQVTVLFADVVRSMEIAEVVGAERLREIISQLVSAAQAVVERYGGRVDKFTGDGVMAVFGAPAALEDHALRACIAALALQGEAKRVAVQVKRRDDIDLQLRIGLNSGEVIAGDVGSAALGYTAVGRQVGMAQRMESVAPPGGVMLSESTARLVRDGVRVGQREMLSIKGSDTPVAGYRLLGVAPHTERAGYTATTLVGRDRDLDTLTTLLKRSLGGDGSVVTLVGVPGIGKSRLVREVVSEADRLGVQVISTFCESHTSDISFHAVRQMLRAIAQIDDLADASARAHVRTRLPEADQQDLLLLDDLLGIADPVVVQPNIDPEARRRRLSMLINTIQRTRSGPALYVIEDAHWIDDASESMLVDLIAVIGQNPSVVIATYRPEYRGGLSSIADARSIHLEPLSNAETITLIRELVGADASVTEIAELIADRAAGNPFFAEEMVRDLAERGVLTGERGAHACAVDVTEVRVPATLQATIAARIDRLDPATKFTVSAAAVIGSSFSADLLAALGIDPVFDAAVRAELIERVAGVPSALYAFRHPLIRAVAYGAQLKSARARMHQRVAAAIEARNPESADENSAVIADHLQSAGDLANAHAWFMRAGGWAAQRDIGAARLSWTRACQIADGLPAETAQRSGMRIAPRTLLCGSAWIGAYEGVFERFDELRELCDAADDKASLAIGMTGLAAAQMREGRAPEASDLASEYMALLEQINDPVLIVGLSVIGIFAKIEAGELADARRWTERALDLAGDDPTFGAVIVGSPLAGLLASRGLVACIQGRRGWREDLDRAVAVARDVARGMLVLCVAYKYVPLIPGGALLADDAALAEINEAVQAAERASDDDTLGNARIALGLALMHRSESDRRRGLELLVHVRRMGLQDRYSRLELPVVDCYTAREQAAHGDPNGAIQVMRAAVQEVLDRGQTAWLVPTTAVLVQELLSRGGADDVAEADAAVRRLTAAIAGKDFVLGEVMLLRLNALLTQARGDHAASRDVVERYRAAAAALDYQGHQQWAEAMA